MGIGQYILRRREKRSLLLLLGVEPLRMETIGLQLQRREHFLQYGEGRSGESEGV